jgi:hypothetical protein
MRFNVLPHLVVEKFGVGVQIVIDMHHACLISFLNISPKIDIHKYILLT